MGYKRPRPTHLAEKLLQIRLNLGLSQREIAKRLGVNRYNHISKYETDKNEPPLEVLLAYARLSGVSMETLVDDKLSLSK